MKKQWIKVGLMGLLMLSRSVSAQEAKPASGFQKRKIKIEEINLISGYYFQDGNNSAITGGKGTERLNDYANSLDFTISFIDRYQRQHSINTDFNIDYYTSASSDQIDPLTRTSASYDDLHIYPSLTYAIKDDNNRTNKSLSYFFSTEWDYVSHGASAAFTKSSKDKNREFSVKAGAFLDEYMVILPSELRPGFYPSGAEDDQRGIDYKPRNSYSLALSLSQVVNERLQMMAVLEPGFQEGLLSTPFHRVYFSNGNHTTERLPGTRFKVPLGLRLSYFAGDQTVIRAFYRFYADTWGMLAHTINLEVPYKISPFFSVSPFYRFNTQQAVNYFKPYGKHLSNQSFYTSDYDLSTFQSSFIGAGVRLSPPGGIGGLAPFNALELRYGYYHRSNGMLGHSVTLMMKFK